MEKLKWRIQVFAFYLFLHLIALLPDRLAISVGGSIGRLMYHLAIRRRRIAEGNIAACLGFIRSRPEWNGGNATAPELAMEVFRNMGRSLAEICLLYHGKGSRLIESLEFRGIEHFEQAKQLDKGLIFLTGHCGNWELLALGYSRHFNTPISVLARSLDNPFLNRIVENLRLNFNNRIIYKSGALKGILSAIKRKETIGILVDQAVRPSDGCLVDFMGRKAWASKLPVILAQKTGVPIVPAFIHRDGDHHVMSFLPAIRFEGDKSDEGTARNVQQYSAVLEKFVLEHPQEWYWVHRRWKRAGNAAQ